MKKKVVNIDSFMVLLYLRVYFLYSTENEYYLYFMLMQSLLCA